MEGSVTHLKPACCTPRDAGPDAYRPGVAADLPVRHCMVKLHNEQEPVTPPSGLSGVIAVQPREANPDRPPGPTVTSYGIEQKRDALFASFWHKIEATQPIEKAAASNLEEHSEGLIRRTDLIMVADQAAQEAGTPHETTPEAHGTEEKQSPICSPAPPDGTQDLKDHNIPPPLRSPPRTTGTTAVLQGRSHIRMAASNGPSMAHTLGFCTKPPELAWDDSQELPQGLIMIRNILKQVQSKMSAVNIT
ncbi:Hypothetical predicted protein [Pelobates cultripes]|uniref:Uncharacterized protein n=1 Tax=Pelobates cultripes TaxID=61616 RepID=A0AAD1RIQ6_PELCU|nr:Hypothetical predicted protein [Pelobates cultripes]